MIWVSSRLCLKALFFSPSVWHLKAQLSKKTPQQYHHLYALAYTGTKLIFLLKCYWENRPHSFHYSSDRHIPMWKSGFVSFTSCSKREAWLVGLNLKACPAKNSCMITNQCCFPRNDITAVFRGWLNMSVRFVFVRKTYSQFLFIITVTGFLNNIKIR